MLVLLLLLVLERQGTAPEPRLCRERELQKSDRPFRDEPSDIPPITFVVVVLVLDRVRRRANS
jgi:hypothetical protein